MTQGTEHALLKWCCRRGMKELDVLLERYLEYRFPLAASDERQAFVELLDLPDPDFASFLLGRTHPAQPRMANVVKRILAPD